MYEWNTNITTDESSNVYLSGSTSSDEGIATPDGFLTTNAATRFWPNAFLVRFNSLNQKVWGTYYGDSVGTRCYRVIVRVDTIYMAGTTTDIEGIATPGAFQSSMIGSASGSVTRLNDCYAPDSLHQISGLGTVCYPSTGILYSVDPVARSLCGRTNTVQLSIAPEPSPIPAISGSSMACNRETKTYMTDSGKSLYSWTV
jgi:hypothetical protein